jgi:hypothetical protein
MDENDPRRVDVLVSDTGSGVASGTIEIKRTGRRQWLPLDATLHGDRLSAHVDDAVLPDGTYELRARVTDRAGWERLTDRRSDGFPMVLTLPLRTETKITTTVSRRARRCRGRRARSRGRARCHRDRLQRGPAAVKGTGSLLGGRVETADGEPLSFAALEVLERSRLGTVLRSGTIAANAAGRFAFRIRRGPSRTLALHYPGTALVKPSATTVAVLVPARVTLRASRHRLRNGESVRFSGRLLGRPLPAGGKLIDLQAYYRRRWRTFATPRTDSKGAWRFRYRFEATRGLVTYRFRALVRREAAYPYELGRSRVLRVTVRGP